MTKQQSCAHTPPEPPQHDQHTLVCPTWARWAPGPRLTDGRVHAVQLSVTIPRYCGNPLKPLRGTRPGSWFSSFSSSSASQPLSDLDSLPCPVSIDLPDTSFPSQTHSDTKLSSSRLSLNAYTRTHTRTPEGLAHAAGQFRAWQRPLLLAGAGFTMTSPRRARSE